MALDLAKRAERAELLRLRKTARREAREERRAARKARWAARWPRWTAWWELRAKEAKIAATVVGSVLAITAGLPRIVSPIGHAAKWVWRFYMDRDVGPPDQPPPTGIASTTIDRVPHPRPPPATPPTKD